MNGYLIGREICRDTAGMIWRDIFSRCIKLILKQMREKSARPRTNERNEDDFGCRSFRALAKWEIPGDSFHLSCSILFHFPSSISLLMTHEEEGLRRRREGLGRRRLHQNPTLKLNELNLNVERRPNRSRPYFPPARIGRGELPNPALCPSRSRKPAHFFAPAEENFYIPQQEEPLSKIFFHLLRR